MAIRKASQRAVAPAKTSQFAATITADLLDVGEWQPVRPLEHLELIFRLLSKDDGYTTVECGILLNLSFIFLEKVLIGL